MNSFIGLWSKKRILRKGRLTGCLILITLIVSILVVALVFSQSMMEGVLKKYILLSSGHISVPGKRCEDVSIDKDYILDITETVSGGALLYSKSSTASLMLKGVKDDYFDGVRGNELTIERTANPTNIHGIVISEKTSLSLHVSLGDKVALFIVPEGNNTTLRPTILFVEGIYTTGYEAMDKNVAFMDFDYCNLLYKDESSILTEIVLIPQYEDKIGTIIREINSVNKTNAFSWVRENSSIYNNFVTTKQSIFLVLVLIILVASYFSASTAQQMVSDDMKEIAVTKLLGATNSQVRKSAFLTVFSINIIGIVFGLIIGIVLSYLIEPILKIISNMSFDLFAYYLLDFEVKIPFKSISVIIVSMLLISSFTIFVSLRKTKNISPIQLFTTL